jgi:hypothetical protein
VASSQKVPLPFENANKIANVCTARGPNPNNGPFGRTEHPPARPLCPPRRRTDQAPTLDNRGMFLNCPLRNDRGYGEERGLRARESWAVYQLG